MGPRRGPSENIAEERSAVGAAMVLGGKGRSERLSQVTTYVNMDLHITVSKLATYDNILTDPVRGGLGRVMLKSVSHAERV